MNATIDPGLESFIPVAENSHFPIQNLPYGIFTPNALSNPRAGVAIGDFILDLSILETEGFFKEILGSPSHIFSKPTLNLFMAEGPEIWRETRAVISNLLKSDESSLRDNERIRSQALIEASQARLLLPVEIGDYTDFYSSLEHATNVGRMFRDEDNPLLPNWRRLPVAYHGRASSIVPGGRGIHRPHGQVLAPGSEDPVFSPTNQLDFELEMGFFIGPGNTQGKPIAVDNARDHIFGMVLVNDWSARDIQKWEYQPLGPFLSKSFATSISPWIVTLEALEPFRCRGPQQQPQPLPYLQSNTEFAYNIELEVGLKTKDMSETCRISRSNYKDLYWSMAQQLAHHTVSGCNMRTGDLVASGTISGKEASSAGSLLELTLQGRTPLELPGGDSRAFLQDGDTVTMSAWCQGDNYRLGFGELVGTVLSNT